MMPRIIMIFCDYMVYEAYSFIFIRPILPLPLIFIIIYCLFFLCFSYKPLWLTLDGVFPKLWVIDAQRSFG